VCPPHTAAGRDRIVTLALLDATGSLAARKVPNKGRPASGARNFYVPRDPHPGVRHRTRKIARLAAQIGNDDGRQVCADWIRSRRRSLPQELPAQRSVRMRAMPRRSSPHLKRRAMPNTFATGTAPITWRRAVTFGRQNGQDVAASRSGLSQKDHYPRSPAPQIVPTAHFASTYRAAPLAIRCDRRRRPRALGAPACRGRPFPPRCAGPTIAVVAPPMLGKRPIHVPPPAAGLTIAAIVSISCRARPLPAPPCAPARNRQHSSVHRTSPGTTPARG
jgi:hypothetical protein